VIQSTALALESFSLSNWPSEPGARSFRVEGAVLGRSRGSISTCSEQALGSKVRLAGKQGVGRTPSDWPDSGDSLSRRSLEFALVSRPRDVSDTDADEVGNDAFEGADEAHLQATAPPGTDGDE
jgi:hypothetical protein